MHVLELVISGLLVALGLVLIVSDQLPRPAPQPGLLVERDPEQLARQIGLGHRFAARLLKSRRHIVDADFLVLARYDVALPTWPLREQLFAYLQPVGPLVHIEELLERMESLSARLRRRARGRARVTG